MLRECPIGRVLREADHTYETISAYRFGENAGLEVLSYPRYLQQAFQVIAGEKERLRIMEEKDRDAKRDSADAARALKHGGSRVR